MSIKPYINYLTGKPYLFKLHDPYDDTAVKNHIANHNNPHGVTKAQIGLDSVDNTSDQNKPISLLQQAALNNKVDNSRVLTDVPANAKFTDTVYDDTDVKNHISDKTNPHDVTLEQARLKDNNLNGDINFNNHSIENLKALKLNNGQEVTWDSVAHTIAVKTGVGNTIIKVGLETLARVYNNTGSKMLKGHVVYPTGAISQDVPEIDYAIAKDHTTITNQVGILNDDIENGKIGYVTLKGVIRNIDTSLLNVGPCYLSDSIPGKLTSVKPLAPSYEILLGLVTKSSINGSIITDIRSNVKDTFSNFWNGTIRETTKFIIESDGSHIKGKLSPRDNTLNLTMLFSDGFSLFDTYAHGTIFLREGTDTNPQPNYIYIPKRTKLLESSTSGFPEEEHIKIANVLLQSASTVQNNKALINRNWVDSLENYQSHQGHLSHISEKIRSFPASYESGVDCTVNVVNNSPKDNIWITTTEGKVLQLHRHTFPVFDLQNNDKIYIVNDHTTPYIQTSNLNIINKDSEGNTLENKSFSLVLWGVINLSDNGSKLMINLPKESYDYSNPDNAINDVSNYADYRIPKDYEGVGFLIARLTFKQLSGSWELIDQEDLRGTIPNLTAGGGKGGSGITSFLGLLDTPNSYSGQSGKVLTVSSGENGIEYNSIATSVFGRTGPITAQDNDYTWNQINKTHSSIADISLRSHSLLEDIGTNTHQQIDAHIANIYNPHGTTKSQIGLGNVKNIDTTNASNITSGTLPSSVLPPVALTSVQTAGSKAQMLGLTTQEGDVVVRTDENKIYIKGPGTTGTISDWVELKTPFSAPVNSVNGKIGTVVLTTDNINEGTNKYFTNTRVTNSPAVLANTAKISAFGDELRPSDIGKTVQPYDADTTKQGVLTLLKLGFVGDVNANYITKVSELSNDRNFISNETDPTVPSHVKSITSTNISHWNTAFTWGNHASAGYLKSESDTLASVIARGNIGSDGKPLLQISGGATYLGSTNRSDLVLASANKPKWRDTPGIYRFLATEDFVTDEINKIKIGGTNLLEDSELKSNSGHFSAHSTTLDNPNNEYLRVISKTTGQTPGLILNNDQYPNIPNEEYVVSFDIKTIAKSSMNMAISDYWDSSSHISVPFSIDNTWKRQSVICNTGKDTYAWYILMISPSTGEGFEIKNVKIEKGNKATDWSPSYKEFAKINGDSNEDFNTRNLTAFGAKLSGINIHYTNEIDTTASNIAINYRNGDGSFDNFKAFNIYNGKKDLIATFSGNSKNVRFYGTLKVDKDAFFSTNLHGLNDSWLIQESGHSTFETVTSKGFYKTGFSDLSVLLAGGGAKALSNFITDQGGTINKALKIIENTPGDGGWNKGGLHLENNNSSTGEAAISMKNHATTTNYWIQGLNQSNIYKWAYGNTFGDNFSKMELTSGGQLTVKGAILEGTARVYSANNKPSPATLGAAAASHTHSIGNISGLQTALDNKSNVGHTHSISDISSLQSTINSINTSLSGKANIVHSHSIGNITGLQSALDGKASKSHTHIISNITGLQTALDGKASTSHTHSISSISNLSSQLSSLNSLITTNKELITTNKNAIDYLANVADQVSRNTSEIDRLQSHNKGNVETVIGTYSSTTDGDQTVYFTHAFAYKCYGVIVSIGNQSHYVRYVYNNRFVINRYDNVSNTTGYYVAFGH